MAEGESPQSPTSLQLGLPDSRASSISGDEEYDALLYDSALPASQPSSFRNPPFEPTASPSADMSRNTSSPFPGSHSAGVEDQVQLVELLRQERLGSEALAADLVTALRRADAAERALAAFDSAGANESLQHLQAERDRRLLVERELEDALRRCQLLEAELPDLRDKLDIAEQRAADEQVRTEDLQQWLDDERRRLHRIEVELEEERRTNEALTAEREETARELARARGGAGDVEAARLRDREEFDKYRDQAKLQAEETARAAEALQRQLDDLKRELPDLRDRLEIAERKASDEHSAHQEVLQQLEKESHARRYEEQRCERERQRADSLEHEMERLSTEIHNLNAQHEQLTRALGPSKEETDEYARRAATAELEVERLGAELSAAQEEYQRSLAQMHRDATRETDALTALAAGLNQHVKSLEVERQQQRAQEHLLREEGRRAATQVADLELVRQQQEAQLDELVKRLAAREVELEDRDREVEEWRQRDLQLQRHLQDWEASAEVQNNANDALQAELRRLAMELTNEGHARRELEEELNQRHEVDMAHARALHATEDRLAVCERELEEARRRNEQAAERQQAQAQELLQTIAEERSKYLQKERQVEQERNKAEGLQQQVVFLQSQLEEGERHTNNLVEAEKAARADLAALRRSVSDMAEAEDKLRAQIESLEERNRQLEAAVANAQVQSTQPRQEPSTPGNTGGGDWQKVAEEERRRADVLQREFCEVYRKLGTAKKEHDDTVQRLRQDLDAERQRADALQNDLLELKEQLEERGRHQPQANADREAAKMQHQVVPQSPADEGELGLDQMTYTLHYIDERGLAPGDHGFAPPSSKYPPITLDYGCYDERYRDPMGRKAGDCGFIPPLMTRLNLNNDPPVEGLALGYDHNYRDAENRKVGDVGFVPPVPTASADTLARALRSVEVERERAMHAKQQLEQYRAKDREERRHLFAKFQEERQRRQALEDWQRRMEAAVAEVQRSALLSSAAQAQVQASAREGPMSPSSQTDSVTAQGMADMLEQSVRRLISVTHDSPNPSSANSGSGSGNGNYAGSGSLAALTPVPITEDSSDPQRETLQRALMQEREQRLRELQRHARQRQELETRLQKALSTPGTLQDEDGPPSPVYPTTPRAPPQQPLPQQPSRQQPVSPTHTNVPNVSAPGPVPQPPQAPSQPPIQVAGPGPRGSAVQPQRPQPQALQAQPPPQFAARSSSPALARPTPVHPQPSQSLRGPQQPQPRSYSPVPGSAQLMMASQPAPPLAPPQQHSAYSTTSASGNGATGPEQGLERVKRLEQMLSTVKSQHAELSKRRSSLQPQNTLSGGMSTPRSGSPAPLVRDSISSSSNGRQSPRLWATSTTVPTRPESPMRDLYQDPLAQTQGAYRRGPPSSYHWDA